MKTMIKRGTWLRSFVWVGATSAAVYCCIEAKALVLARSRLDCVRGAVFAGRAGVVAPLLSASVSPRDQSVPAAAATVVAASAVDGGVRTVRSQSVESVWEPLMNNPGLQNLYLAAGNAELDVLYLPLYRKLGFGQQQIEEFRALVNRRMEQGLDLTLAHRATALPYDDGALATLRAQSAAEFSRRMRSLLGGAGYQCFLDYERSLPVRRVVNELAGALALIAEPLATQQAEGLTQVLAEASPPFVEGAAADPNHIDWSRAISEAEKVLTPPQQRIFRNAVPGYVPPVEDFDSNGA